MNKLFLKPWFSVVSISVFCLLAVGCEGEFAGKREYNVKILNGPYQMKIVEIAGTKYLAVLNTNYRFQAETGSLQFYGLSNPAAPTIASDLTLEMPSNVSDFEIDSTTLYVADRNKHQILIYDFSGGVFSKRLDSKSEPVVINVTDQPQRLLAFTRSSDSVKALAIVCQSSGITHFVRLDTLEFIKAGSAPSGTPDLIVSSNIAGGNVYMSPRRSDGSTDDPIYLSPSQEGGFGINHLISLAGGTNQIFVTASAVVMGLFSFRLDTFQNASNFAWNLSQRRDGTNINNQDYPGTHESGFRGLAGDGLGNVYATSRDDNGLYKFSRSDFDKAKESVGGESVATRNTQGFKENIQGRLLKTLDTNLTDNIFPRLAGIALNYCPGVSNAPSNCTVNEAASVAWILGLGTFDGDTRLSSAKVYRVNLTDLSVKESADSVLGDSPQRILWYYPASLLYIANLKSNTISILRDDDLTAVGLLKN